MAAIILVSLNTARERARDAQRISDMRQMQTALELSYDTQGQYPANPQGIFPDGGTCGTCIEGARSATWAEVVELWGGSLPLDPTHAGTTSGYRYRISNVNGRQSYTMLVHLEANPTWCHIGTDPGHSSWTTYQTCF